MDCTSKCVIYLHRYQLCNSLELCIKMNILVNDQICDYTYVWLSWMTLMSLYQLQKPNDELFLFNMCYFVWNLEKKNLM